MAPASPQSVLHRLIARRDGTRRARPDDGTDTRAEIDPDRAAGLALARTAERQARLPVIVEQVERVQTTLAELAEVLPERALLAVVEGVGDGLGVVAICPDLLASLIEMQAMGRISARAVVARRPTRTDAAIASDFVNALLAELTRDRTRGADGPDYGSFRYATYLDDPRPLALMLEDGVFSRLSLRFRMGAGGQREGRLMIALPAAAASPTAPARPAGLPAPSLAQGAAGTGGGSLAAMVQTAPITLTGVLCRRKMSLQSLRRLAPGALIPLPQNVLDDARIETSCGQVIARGRLGEANGLHAIRLRGPGTGASQPDPILAEAWHPGARGGLPPGSADDAPSLADFGGPDPFRAGLAAAAGLAAG